MISRSVPSSPCSPTSSILKNCSFKIQISRDSERRDSIKTSQKIIKSSQEFENVRKDMLRTIDENKQKLEIGMTRNQELRAELEELLKSGYSTSKVLKRNEEKKDSLIEYYRNKLEEIEKLAESQKKDLESLVKSQESENNALKKIIKNSESRIV